MTDDRTVEGGPVPLMPREVVALTAFICAGVLVAIAALGPLGSETIQYRTSQSGVWQLMGQDLANVVLIAPALLLGGVLHLMGRDSAKYFLILAPITLMYAGLSIGIGQEWGSAEYDGNIEQYAWLFMILVVGGLLLLVAIPSMFSKKDAPDFGRRGLRIYVAVMAVFMALFAFMWISELMEVMSSGGTASGAYESTPTLWWTVRYFDLGVTIPLGFVSLYLLLRDASRSYPLVLLAFGFFVTTGTAVNSMGWIMFLNDDPEFQPAALVIFAVLGVLSYGGYLYLVKDKLKKLSRG